MITTKITSREKEITTLLLVQASAPTRDYSLLIVGSSGVDGDGFRRSIPIPAGCRNRINLTPKLVGDGGGALLRFWENP